MGKLKSTGVREFRNNASTHLSGTDAIAVNKHGQVIGFYILLERNRDEVRRAIAKLGVTRKKELVYAGVFDTSEEVRIEIFDWI
ncbi:MAG: hypothetical protein M0T78_00285 [Actinomycetota bacterium]|nr:hypothetical protein [Actinomycetota bacterium]